MRKLEVGYLHLIPAKLRFLPGALLPATLQFDPTVAGLRLNTRKAL
jgi:hypothetical protein